LSMMIDGMMIQKRTSLSFALSHTDTRHPTLPV
jgi:hypothetical protein